MNIHIYHHDHNSDQINHKLDILMSKITDLQAEVESLQVSVDAEQAQIAILLEGQTATITALNAVIDDLKAQLAEVGSPTDIQAVIDRLEAIKADVESTVVETTTTTEAP